MTALGQDMFNPRGLEGARSTQRRDQPDAGVEGVLVKEDQEQEGLGRECQALAPPQLSRAGGWGVGDTWGKGEE